MARITSRRRPSLKFTALCTTGPTRGRALGSGNRYTSPDWTRWGIFDGGFQDRLPAKVRSSHSPLRPHSPSLLPGNESGVTTFIKRAYSLAYDVEQTEDNDIPGKNL